MTKSDFSMIPNNARVHPAFPAFSKAMLERAYGPTQTLDAWMWFRAGWTATAGRAALDCREMLHDALESIRRYGIGQLNRLVEEQKEE